MNRNSGNVSKTNKLVPGVGNNNSKANRKSFQKVSESSSLSSNRNSSAHSEEDVRVGGGGVYVRPQVTGDVGPFEEQEQAMKKLQTQVKELRHKLRILEESVDSKDYSLGTISREKDRAVGEIRRLERSNKQLRQQLSEERTHYLEEKEKFVEEMNRYKKRFQEAKGPKKGNPGARSKQSLITQSLRWRLDQDKGDFEESKAEVREKRFRSRSQKAAGGRSSFLLGSFSSESRFRKTSSLESLHLYEGDDLSLQTAALRTENAKLRSIICERDERNYELCLRFLRMKHCKNDIRSRFQDLENEYLQVIANLMDKIDEARQEFNFIIDQKFKRPLHSTNAMYLQLVQRNSRMAFENASLRLENQCLKKELNKYVNDRKFDQETGPGTDTKLATKDSTEAEGTSKRTKKNVNFKEIRTIYEREFGFKNSDTDSNYMSKTTTTVPSNGSLDRPKSNESVARCQEVAVPAQDTEPPCFQANTLPSEILNKIFKRIDTSCCPSIESSRQKEPDLEMKISKDASTDARPNPEDDVHFREGQTSEKKKLKESVSSRKLQKNPEIKISDSSSPCDSKESVRLELKDRSEPPVFSLQDFGKKSEEEQRSFRHRFGYQGKDSLYYDKDSGDGSSSLEFPVRRHRLPQSPSTQPRTRSRREIADSCGLEEKLEASDLELSLPAGEGKAAEGEAPEVRVKEDEELGRGFRSESVSLRTRSRSNNVLSLRDELMEAAIKASQQQQQQQDTDVTQARKPESSKRFSQRLISTSPEQLRSILTESQLGAFYQMAPIIVGHAAADVGSGFQRKSSSNDIVLQLVIPAAGVGGTLPVFPTTYRDQQESLRSPGPPERKQNFPPGSSRTSDVQIPASSIQTSSSTMDVVDGGTSPARRSLLLRTLSAPGLLESSWLDPQTVCEMRDCGTNT